MIFGNIYREGECEKCPDKATTEPIDAVIADPDSPAGVKKIASEVDDAMQIAAVESMDYFENGAAAREKLVESVEFLNEARKLGKRTVVRIGKDDDLKRRENLAAIILAREAKDPLYTQYAIARAKEKKLRQQLYIKYNHKAQMIAKVSQREHMKKMRTMPALPSIKA